ncbi:unnamed protein product, partial [Anisakis simplex]|uniref:TFG domain-containing protein n=1 Tax=Anisakis simplex TaxID=6269 RepID=A0A0M3JPG5_ANISI
MVFSDDESEKRFMAKRRRQKGTSLSSNADDSAKEQSQCSGEKRLRCERRGKWRKGDGQQGPMNQNSNRGRGRFNRGNFASNNAGAPSGRGRGMMRGFVSLR